MAKKISFGDTFVAAFILHIWGDLSCRIELFNCFSYRQREMTLLGGRNRAFGSKIRSNFGNIFNACYLLRFLHSFRQSVVRVSLVFVFVFVCVCVCVRASYRALVFERVHWFLWFGVCLCVGVTTRLVLKPRLVTMATFDKELIDIMNNIGESRKVSDMLSVSSSCHRRPEMG